MHTRTPRSRWLIAAATLAAATTIAACGSSSPNAPASSASPTSPTAGGSTAPAASMVPFSRCMRAHGVPGFPDLPASGLRIAAAQGPTGTTLSVNGVTVDAPAFQAARQTCQHYLPGIHATVAQTAQMEKRGLDFARCMRSHGVPSFPDPSTGPGPGGSQVARVLGVNLQSPAVQAAAKACGGFGPKGP